MIKSSRVTGFYLEGAGGLLHDQKGFSVIHIRGAGVDAGGGRFALTQVDYSS